MKTVTILQLPMSNKNIFRSYNSISSLNLDDYVSIWYSEFNSGFYDNYICEKMFNDFNSRLPEHYAGHSLSVSDVLSIYDNETNVTNNYYCDSFGWEKFN